MNKYRIQNWPMLAQICLVFLLVGNLIGFLSGERVRLDETEYLKGQIEGQYKQLLTILESSTKDAIIAEDLSLLSEILNEVGSNDKNIAQINIFNDENNLITQWKVQEYQNNLYELSSHKIMVKDRYQGSIQLKINLEPALYKIQLHVRNIQLLMASLLFILLFFMILLMYQLSIKPVRLLDERLRKLGAGDFRTDFHISGAAEIQHLVISINDVSKRLESQRLAEKKHSEELRILNEAYVRFVPDNFLSHLNRSSIIDVQLGDQVATEMSVLFIDIRSFTPLSESLSPKETFQFINSYLNELGPLIRKNNGFIDKYIGDAIMALFISPEDSVLAGVSMLEQLKIFNEKRTVIGEKPICVGIGIHTGNVMLGTIGEANRMEGTVIGDTVKLAARLETLTKEYNHGEGNCAVRMLISEDTKDALSSTSSLYIRFVDSVIAKGKSVSTNIYEVYSADEDEIKEIKQHNASIFQGVLAGTTKNDEELDWKDGDPLLELYRAHCTQHLNVVGRTPNPN
jgi:class 3 adenylate cyclase